MREIPEVDARRILAAFEAHCAAGAYRFVTIGDREYALAGRWLGAFKTPLRTLDALHLAAAHAHGLPLVTVDRALARSAQTLGVTCMPIV
jgi:predicted nucleic acid-binding protein